MKRQLALIICSAVFVLLPTIGFAQDPHDPTYPGLIITGSDGLIFQSGTGGYGRLVESGSAGGAGLVLKSGSAILQVGLPAGVSIAGSGTITAAGAGVTFAASATNATNSTNSTNVSGGTVSGYGAGLVGLAFAPVFSYIEPSAPGYFQGAQGVYAAGMGINWIDPTKFDAATNYGNFQGCALGSGSNGVDGVLHQFVTNGIATGFIDISGGSNSPPAASEIYTVDFSGVDLSAIKTGGTAVSAGGYTLNGPSVSLVLDPTIAMAASHIGDDGSYYLGISDASTAADVAQAAVTYSGVGGAVLFYTSAGDPVPSASGAVVTAHDSLGVDLPFSDFTSANGVTWAGVQVGSPDLSTLQNAGVIVVHN